MSTPDDDDAPGVAPPPGVEPQPEPESVGSATMLDDGTLQLELRTVAADGTIGEALLMVPPGDPRHAGFVKHLGGIRPGEFREIPPFPQEG